jgi:hypothetical protein
MHYAEYLLELTALELNAVGIFGNYTPLYLSVPKRAVAFCVGQQLRNIIKIYIP